MKKTIHKHKTVRPVQIPFDDWAKESLSAWIILNLPLMEWESAASEMAAWVKLALRERPTLLSEYGWETIYVVATRKLELRKGVYERD